jgi:hypothetical protein
VQVVVSAPFATPSIVSLLFNDQKAACKALASTDFRVVLKRLAGEWKVVSKGGFDRGTSACLRPSCLTAITAPKASGL